MTCETAEEGLEAIKSQNYDIIIVDYKLPGMDGLEFLKRVRGSHPQAMKILATAYRSDDLVSAAIQIGIEDFIEKPFTAKTFEESLWRLIEKREQKIKSF